MSINRLLVVIVAMVTITALAVVALMHNIDGALLATAFALIGGLAGWSGAQISENRRRQVK